MTTVVDAPVPATIGEPTGVAKLLRRPKATHGLWSWFTTVDHKRIGILYIATAVVFFVIAGLEALVIRLQLYSPNGTVLTANTYNEFFTMHGTTMVFLVGMPIAVGFANYLVPLQIGTRDVAFPRINMFGYWAFLFGGLFIYSSFLLGGAPNTGWFGHTPLSSAPEASGFLPGSGPAFWSVGLILLGIGSTTSAINIVVTILNLRAPGMTLMRMPVLTWMMLVIAFMTAFAIPVVTASLVMVYMSREFGALFFTPAAGGEPLLYQHLFWLFGHPEVYILVLPGMGIVSELLPVFSRKPLFGYTIMVFSGIAIGFLGWGVWAHHMFTTGLGPLSLTFFSVATMTIAIPTGVKIFNWVGTMWGGSLRFTVPMAYSIAFVAMFTLGGLSGVMVASAPADYQEHDSYFVVAHFHYVLFGGLILAVFGGMTFWFPKAFGRLMSEKAGWVSFWLILIGFNLTFMPMHFAGLAGMPRRTYQYGTGTGWETMNRLSTVGGFVIALGVLIWAVNAVWSGFKGKVAGNDPWDARTLEWSIPSPPPDYNFAEIPTVTSRDDFWHQKYTEDDEGRLVRLPAGAEATAAGLEHEHKHVHLPSPSYYPLILALGLPIIGYGAVFTNYWLVALGVFVLAFGMYGWALEPDAE